MITVKEVEQPLTLIMLNDFGRLCPVVYVLFSSPNVEAIVSEISSSGEPGELAVIADFDSAGEVTKKYGASTRESLLGFAIHTFVGLATHAEQYPLVIRDTRDWRRRQNRAEKREWKDS